MNCPHCNCNPFPDMLQIWPCGSTRDHRSPGCADRIISKIKDAGDRLFEELDDLTPEANCKCIPHGERCKSCTYKEAREALKKWKEAIK